VIQLISSGAVMLCGCLVGGIGHGVVYLLFYISFFFFFGFAWNGTS